MYLSENDSVNKIKNFFLTKENKYSYINQKGNEVTCKCLDDGVEVSCLVDSAHRNFLPWSVFWHAVHIMLINGGKAVRGNATNQGTKLGSIDLPFSSVEGHIAHVVYGKQVGDSVFRRISPVAHILIAAQVCIDQRGDLQLSHYPEKN
ncbi:MAG: hypothetical protein ACXWEW_09020 [Nitrososphaeraceae archaeon]